MRDALAEPAEIARPCLGVGDQRHRAQILEPRAQHLDPRRASLRRGEHLAADQWCRPRHPRHRAEPSREIVVIGDQLARVAEFVGRGGVIDGDMGVGAENTRGEFLAKADHHRLHDDQRRHPQRDPEQRVPGDHRDAAVAPPRPQVAPGDRPFETGEGPGIGGGIRHEALHSGRDPPGLRDPRQRTCLKTRDRSRRSASRRRPETSPRSRRCAGRSVRLSPPRGRAARR